MRTAALVVTYDTEREQFSADVRLGQTTTSSLSIYWRVKAGEWRTPTGLLLTPACTEVAEILSIIAPEPPKEDT